jgi:hypothetical protein
MTIPRLARGKLWRNGGAYPYRTFQEFKTPDVGHRPPARSLQLHIETSPDTDKVPWFL